MSLPPKIAELLSSNSENLLEELMPAIAEFLHCDRCFLYLRNPQTRLGRVPFCWVRSPEVPTVYDDDWKPEPDSLPDEDPMFAAALQTKPSIFVEDVNTASPEILNQQFEQENFGHRALIHGHICENNQLWGVLQPCMMNEPRRWTPEERAAIAQIIASITPTVTAYVKAADRAKI